jgi:hypothetical protein
MVKISLTAIAVALVLAACQSSSDQSPEARPGSTTSTTMNDAAPRTEDRCSAAAAGSRDGKEARVRMVVTPCRVEPGQAPNLVLINDGETSIAYAPPFVLERKTAQGWRWINKRQGFNMPLYGLGPGHRSRPELVALYLRTPTPIRLEPGTYRVTKSVGLGLGRPRQVRLRVNFRVARSA